MRRDPQWKILVSYLREKGGKATLRQIHEDCWIQNVPDAKMQAKRKGFDIRVESLHPNPKISSYVLHEKTPRFSSEVKNHEHAFKETQSMFSDQPTKTRAYE